VFVRPSARLRFLFGCAAIPAVAALGVTAAICIPVAHADGLLSTLPTITLPVTTVTLPVVPTLPIVTTGTSTTTPTGTTATQATGTTSDNGGAGATTTSVPDVADRNLAGAIHLPAGVVSIPVASVTAPVRLVVDRITVSPRSIGVRGQRVRIVVRVADSRGYRVRGASVDVRSTPVRMVRPAAARKTGIDGSVSLQLTTTPSLRMRTGSKLVLVVRAYQAGAASSSIVARRVVSLPVKPR
jgi:hypothetical protein